MEPLLRLWKTVGRETGGILWAFNLQAEALRRGEPIPARLASDTLVVPTALDKIFNGDLKAAEIPKRDGRGRTLDVRALRTTFGTLLGRGGVPLRTAQAAMRHSDPKLTANVYTDPKLLDVEGALDALPTLLLDAGPNGERESVRATGAHGIRLKRRCTARCTERVQRTTNGVQR